MENEIVQLEVTSDQALVLFDFLARELDDRNGEKMKPSCDHDAELWALNSVLRRLEATLVTPFQPDYKELVDQARGKLLAERGDWPT